MHMHIYIHTHTHTHTKAHTNIFTHAYMHYSLIFSYSTTTAMRSLHFSQTFYIEKTTNFGGKKATIRAKLNLVDLAGPLPYRFR
jgi:hypothetical protein